MLTLPKHNRYDYSIIGERNDYAWPGGKRLAFCLTTNIEVYAYRRGTGWDPAKKGEPQQQRNYSWRDYGNRVGIWRLFDLFEQLNLPAAHNINSLLYEYHPQICERIRKRGDEVVGHGRTNAERQGDLWELDERRLIDDVTQEITRREGHPPTGWMGPAASESNVTPDLLKEAGYRYVMDWPADDQPFWLQTRAGPILSVPYPAELNDSAAIIHRDGTARDFADMIVDGFDEMIEQCRAQPLVMTISLHPFVMGQPFRLPALRRALTHCVEHRNRDRVWWTTPGAVADACYALPAGTIPGEAAGDRALSGRATTPPHRGVAAGNGVTRTAYSFLIRRLRRSIDADAARPDRGGPLLGFARHEFLQVIRRPAVGRDNRHADLLQPFLYRGCVHGRNRRIVELLDHRRGRALGQEEAAPEIRIEIDEALFVRAWEIRQDRRAITRQDRNRLHRLAFDLRLAGRCERAEIIDPAGNEILHRGRRTAIGDVGDVDTHRGVELRAGQMGSRPDSGRPVLHLSLVGFRVSDEPLQIVGRQFVARDQQQRLLHH